MVGRKEREKRNNNDENDDNDRKRIGAIHFNCDKYSAVSLITCRRPSLLAYLDSWNNGPCHRLIGGPDRWFQTRQISLLSPASNCERVKENEGRKEGVIPLPASCKYLAPRVWTLLRVSDWAGRIEQRERKKESKREGTRRIDLTCHAEL